MAENQQPKSKKLGQSTNIKIGGKQYTSYNMPNLKQQTKEVHTVKGMENAPRDISRKKVDNQQNVIKTENIKSLTDNKKSGSMINKKETSTTNKTTVNSSKTKIDPKLVKASEVKQQAQQRVQRQSAIVVTPQTIISKPKVQSGYNAPNTKRKPFTAKKSDSMINKKETNTINKSTINSSKTKVDPKLVKTSEVKQQTQQRIRRQSAIVVTPQTIISKPKVQSGYNAPNTKRKPFTIKKTGTGDKTINSTKTKIPPNVVKLDSEVTLSADQIDAIVKSVDETIARANGKDWYYDRDFERYVERITGYRYSKPSNDLEFEPDLDKNLTKNIQRENTIVVTPQTVISKPKIQTNVQRPIGKTKIHTSIHRKINYGGILTTAKKEAQNALNAQDDSGSKTLSTALSMSGGTVKVYKTAQKVSPHIIKSAVGMYHVGEKTVKVVNSIDATIGMIRTGTIKLDSDTAMRIKNMAVYKLKSTRPAQTLIHAVTGVKTAIDTTKYYTIKLGHGVQRATVLVKGMALGTVRIKIDKNTLNAIKNVTIRGAKVGGRFLGRTVKTGVIGGVRAGIHIGSKVNRGLLGAGNMLTNTGDTGTQVLGYGLKTTHYAIKGISYTPRLAKATYKGVKTGINTMVKTGKFVNKSYNGIKTGIKVAKKIGGKEALKLYGKRWGKSVRGKALKAIRKAGSSIVTAVIEGVKALGTKVIIPLMLIILIVLCGANVISSFVTAISSILSPFFTDDTGAEVDESAWLTSHITDKRNDLIQDIKDTYKDNLVENGGEYHYVRFFNLFNDTEIELNDTNINTSIYTVEEYQQYIQPIFHTLIMSEYELEASETQMQGILDDIWSKMSFIVTEELPVEYCHMTKTDNADGTYTITPVKEKDDNVHADITTCPNYSEIQHHGDDTSKPLCSCDYWYWKCQGHTNSEGETEKCSDGKMTHSCSNSKKHKGCNGYYICGGHKILSLSVELKGFGDLLNEYYLTEINALESMPSLTADEQHRLQSLNEYYEICLSYALILEEEFGNGDGTVVDLDGVTLTDITDFACQFIGKPYVWGGTDPNTGADCSGFVKYVYAHFGVSLPRVSQDQVTCGTTVASISDAQAGDLIFWSHNGSDSGVYHVAMYLGGGKMIHASNSKPYPQGGIKISNVYGTPYKIKRIAH